MPATALDLSYARAVPILPKQTDHFQLYLVGCSGVGSWLAPSLARIARTVGERYQRDVQVFYSDGGSISASEVDWQNFAGEEVSESKARTLAARYAAAWGLNVVALNHLRDLGAWNSTSCLITCGSAQSRLNEVKNFLGYNDYRDDCAGRWWLRVLQNQARSWAHLGSSMNSDTVRRGFSLKTLCGHTRMEVADEIETHGPLTVIQAMSQMAMDQIAAADAADFVLRWLTGSLKRFSTVHRGPQAWSRYVTPKTCLDASEPKCPFDPVREAATVPAPTGSVSLVVVGCGGTGSWLMPSVARLGRAFRSMGRNVRVIAVDFDIVEPANVLRQNFCDAERGRNKAATLAERFSPVFGGRIDVIEAPLTASMMDALRADTTILVGCVDNAPARRELAAALDTGDDVWWLDCGHHYDSGQVVLGSTLSLDCLRNAIRDGACFALPALPMLHPELLSPAKRDRQPALSCEEHAHRNTQSLIVNQRGAAYATYYLVRFLSGQLDSFATYYDLPAGATRTEWITPASVQAICARREITSPQ